MTLSWLTLAFSAGDGAAQLGRIFYFIVVPILVLAGLGFLLQRRLGLDMATLTRLNFYLTIPCVIFHSVVSAPVRLSEIGQVVGFSLTLMTLLGLLAYGLARWRGVPPNQRNALVMTSVFYNSGNYGLPLQDLAFRSAGGSASAEAMVLQVFVMIVQNVTSFTVGILLATGGRGDGIGNWRKTVRQMTRFPPLYALLAGLLTVQIGKALGDDAAKVAAALSPFWNVTGYIYRAFIAVALVTLGAQLATVRSGAANYPVRLSVVLRLLAGPALGVLLIVLFGLDGFVAQVLLIGTAMPTSVNCMLLCLEFKNQPDAVARTVFYTTLLSPLTVTLVVSVARGGLWGALAM